MDLETRSGALVFLYPVILLKEERSSDKEKAPFLSVAKGGSLAELRTQLLIAIEIQYLPKRIGQDMTEEYLHLSRGVHSYTSRLATCHSEELALALSSNLNCEHSTLI